MHLFKYPPSPRHTLLQIQLDIQKRNSTYAGLVCIHCRGWARLPACRGLLTFKPHLERALPSKLRRRGGGIVMTWELESFIIRVYVSTEHSWHHRCVTCTVTQGPALLRAPCLVLYSAVVILQFSIVFQAGGSAF